MQDRKKTIPKGDFSPFFTVDYPDEKKRKHHDKIKMKFLVKFWEKNGK